MPGARCTRGLVCRNCAFGRTRAYRAAETLRHPLRNGFTAYFVLSPVSGLVVTVTPEKLASQELDASVAAPGPHDFAVRAACVRLSQAARPPHPTARFVTIASRPSHRVRQAEVNTDLARRVKRNNFAFGAWH